MNYEPRWLVEARKLIGLSEIPGKDHAAEIVKLWKDAGLPFEDDEVPWCAGFVGGCLARAQVKPTGSALARSYSKWGFDVLDQGVVGIPNGAIVVYSRDGNMGHVGFAVGRTANGEILTLGGNQSNKVSIRPFNPSRLLAARWPAEHKSDLHILVPIPKLTTAEAVSNNET